MNFDLTEDQLAFREAARAFAEKAMAPHAAKWDAEHVFPVEVIREAGEMGFCGIYTPEAQGGMGLSRLDTSVIVEELAAACPSTAAYITIHNMATWMVAQFGNADIQKQIAPKMASGEWLGSYCLTEPGAGSDAGNLRTKATRDGDSYVLNGSKVFISGAGATQMLVVIDYTATAIALPSMAREFNVSADSLQWVITGYILSFSILLAVAGPLGDRYGRKRLLLLGVLLFGGCSAWVGAAGSVTELIVSRIALGVGGGLLFPLSTAVVGAGARCGLG